MQCSVPLPVPAVPYRHVSALYSFACEPSNYSSVCLVDYSLTRSLAHLFSSPRPLRILRLLRTKRMAVGVRENARRWRRAVRVASDVGAEAGMAALAAAERADVVFAWEEGC
jgi:hypothetical protein